MVEVKEQRLIKASPNVDNDHAPAALLGTDVICQHRAFIESGIDSNGMQQVTLELTTLP